ncbi:MAG: YfhO family protein, partial [Myxococcaceae bacterium]
VDALKADNRRWVGIVFAAATVPLIALHLFGFGAPTAAAVVLVVGLVIVVLKNQRHRAVALAVISAIELFAAQLEYRAPGWLRLDVVDHPSLVAKAIREEGPGRISVVLDSTESFFLPDNLIRKSRDALYPLRWYEEKLEAIEGYGAPEPLRQAVATELHPPGRALYDLASVRFFVRPSEKPFADLRERLSSPIPLVIRNADLPEDSPVSLSISATALPRAFVVHRLAHASDEEVLQKLSSDTQEFRTTAFSSENVEASGDCSSTAARVDPDHRTVVINVNACAPGVLVVNDSYYPGWKVTVDDEPSRAFVVDYLFRGVAVPKGEHTVRMHYEPLSSELGLGISVLSLAGLAIALTRKRKTAAPEGAAVSRQQPGPA